VVDETKVDLHVEAPLAVLPNRAEKKNQKLPF